MACWCIISSNRPDKQANSRARMQPTDDKSRVKTLCSLLFVSKKKKKRNVLKFRFRGERWILNVARVAYRRVWLACRKKENANATSKSFKKSRAVGYTALKHTRWAASFPGKIDIYGVRRVVSVPSSWTSHRGESVNSNLITAGLPIWAKLGKTLGEGRGGEGDRTDRFRLIPGNFGGLIASSPATLWSLRVVDRRDSSTRVVSFRCRNSLSTRFRTRECKPRESVISVWSLTARNRRACAISREGFLSRTT